MSGETNLQTILRTLEPKLNEGEYVFCVFTSMPEAVACDPLCTFIETEGVTGILRREIADSMGIPYTATFAWITLTVHSSLEAVGLTSAFARALTEEGISCNVVAAFYHDHIFVPVMDAEKAIDALRRLAKS